MMWALDPADGSCWLGGALIDQACQGQGYSREAVRAAIRMLSEAEGYQDFALSYSPSNTRAKHLYEMLGFVETDDWEGNEIVARLSVEGLISCGAQRTSRSLRLCLWTTDRSESQRRPRGDSHSTECDDRTMGILHHLRFGHTCTPSRMAVPPTAFLFSR